MEKKEIAGKLLQAQAKIKAPKGQYNSFGKYHYRSCEDILEGAKAVCHEFGLTLLLSDEIVSIGTRFYVRATASVTDGIDFINTTAYARECDSKKGMDEAQITGSASSYARKYALNGLFCIDDTKDADTRDNTSASGTISVEETVKIQNLIDQTDTDVDLFLVYMEASSLGEIKANAYKKAISSLNAKLAKMNGEKK